MSVIAIAGEASRIASGQVTDYLARIRRPGDHAIVDLSGLRLLDASGIQALLRCDDTCAADGTSLHLTGALGDPARLLQISDLPMYATVEEAINVVRASARHS
ncbi:STAS domain-containing protein [Nonomuraea sp. NPDC001699]